MLQYTAFSSVKTAFMALAAILALGFLFISQIPAGATPNGITRTDPPAAVPDTVFFDGDDRPQRLVDHKGKLLVVNFWATWCAPCVREMPSLGRLQAALAKDDIAILPLSLDRQGGDLVKEFYSVNKINHLPVLVDKKSALSRAFGVRGLPTSIIVNREGLEVARVVGELAWDDPRMIKFLKTLAGKAPLTEAKAE